MKKFLSRDYFGRTNSSLSCSFSPQGLFRPARFISILLFSPQGLFRPAGFISILLFFFTGIISASRIHLYLALLCYRDYFGRPDSSLSCSFSPQGLFQPARFISSLLFFSTGIISPRSDASLSCFFSPQGLFRPAGFIFILLLCATGIISASQIHLYLALFLRRDYFSQPDSSLSCSFSPQGLFRLGQMHLYLALLLYRDYFNRPDSSLSGFSVPQGLFQPPGFIPIWLFCSAGIISPRSDTSPIAENISARPFRQFKFVLLGNEAMICS